MNKTVRIALAVVSIVLAVAVALSVVLGIDAAGKAGRNLAETEFDRFTNTLRGVKSLDELNDPFLRERLVALYKGSKPLLAAMITDQAGQVVWRIPAETPYLSADRSTFVGPKTSTTSYSSQITGNINLVALYTTLPQTKIFSILRSALIVLGVYVLAVIVFVLVMSLLKPETKTVPRSYEQPIVRPGPPTLRGEKPRPAAAPGGGGTARVQTAATPRPKVSDLASSRLVADVPLQTSQSKVAALAGQGLTGNESPKTVASAPGTHDIEFPEMENSADSKYRAIMSGTAAARPSPDSAAPRMAGPKPADVGHGAAGGESSDESFRSRVSSAEDTARALAEFEASYKGIDSGSQAQAEASASWQVEAPPRTEPRAGPSPSASPQAASVPGAAGRAAPVPTTSGIQTPGQNSQSQFRAFQGWETTTQPAQGAGSFHETAIPSGSAGSGESIPSEYTLGLYSPISGLGWERNLPEKLETEIARSQAEGGDVSLLMVSFDGLTSRDPMYPAFTASIKDYFSIRDLAFECGPGGFALILPNIDVKRAVRLTEDLLKSLKSMISLYREPSPYLPLYMGISAVAGRAVPAGRVIKEATAALQKARTDQDSHIVAFNPDPARYKRRTEGYGAANA